MLDIKKLRKECLGTLHSISDEEFNEWYNSYTKRIALEDEKWEQMTLEERYSHIFATNCASVLDIALSDGSLNGAPQSVEDLGSTIFCVEESQSVRIVSFGRNDIAPHRTAIR